MKKEFAITISETALWSLQDIESFKSNYIPPSEAAQFVDTLLSLSVKAISQDPLRYRPNQMLADKGLLIRERLDIKNQFRCLYHVDNTRNKVEILLFMSTQQDLEKLLYRYFLLR